MPYLKDRYLSTITRTVAEVKAKIYTPVAPLTMTAYLSKEPLTYEHRTEGRMVTLKEGDAWAEQVLDCAWFHFEGVIPPACEGKETVCLIDVNGEGLIVDDQGNAVQGITCVDSGFTRRNGTPGKWVYPWTEKGVPGEKIDFWMDAGCNDLFGALCGVTVKLAQIGVMDRRMFNLYFDLVVLANYLEDCDDKSARYNQILFTLYDACVKDDIAALEEAAKFLLTRKAGDAALTFNAIGHAHIDLGWLWPIRETKRKGARTFATVLNLMEKYPDYVFGASQPQLFQWMKEDYPELYGRMKEKVLEGRIEAQGCMWVEADANLAGGEALVRQIIYGKKFFMDEFGKDIKVLWLPDVFGYNGNLPQLLKKSGNEVFATQKLSWSQQNRFPHHTFRWKGIDGTEIFTHMFPANTYNSPLMPWNIKFAEENYSEKGLCDEALMLFGIGDGGGGPGVEHMEAAKRVKEFQGLCPVKQGHAQPMLLRLKDKYFDRVPVWSGELYLERHQGTYTTAARSKKFNRKMELALRDLELLCVMTGTDCKAELDEIWKEVLLYQFHDILPGSSIQRVYDESLARYEQMMARVKELQDQCMAKLASGKTWFNTLSWDRSAVVEGEDGFYRITVPAMGYTSDKGEKLPELTISAAPMILENRFLKAIFDETGALVSLLDKRNDRESLSAPSNRYAVWKEEGKADCWDIDIEYTDLTPEYFTLAEQSFQVEGANAVCRQKYVYGESVIDVAIRLGEDDECLTFDTHVNWQESKKMLRATFDANVLADHAGFDIQYGAIHRTNNENTLWDKAKFEVCAHKWVDLSENAWGLALLNDCKYGFRVKGNVIDMNILRAQHNPSYLTDRGDHDLSYALYPHAGNEQQGRVKKYADAFNAPLLQGFGTAETAEYSFAKAEGVIVEAVKPAEDGNGVILRAYEPYGSRGKMHIALDGEYTITPCDLLEKPIAQAAAGSVIMGETKPFEIHTWRLEKQ